MQIFPKMEYNNQVPSCKFDTWHFWKNNYTFCGEKIMKKYIGLLLLFSLIGVIYSQIPTSMLTNEQKHYVSFENTKSLEQYFRWDEQRKPLIGAHRGGPLQVIQKTALRHLIIHCDMLLVL